MKQELLGPPQWRSPLLVPRRRLTTRCVSSSLSLAPVALETPGGGELSAKERRQLRKERRERRNWREEVEERLLVKPKKEYKSWTEKLNLDNLATLGTQWWVVRVARVNAHETAEIIARALARNYPHFHFKVYYPAVKEQRKLKNGTHSVKLKPLFPGCVFLNCVMNKEIHDFIREVDRVGGFVGSKVGNTKRQINKPKPVPIEEMEAIFQQAKEEQEKFDMVFKEEQEKSIITGMDSVNKKKSTASAKASRQSKKRLEPSIGENNKSLVPGATVHVLSGPFAQYTGRLKELDHKSGKAIVGFKLFGKESFVELEVDQVVADTT